MYADPGVNAADVAESVIRRAESLKGTVIPDGVEFTVTRNYGETATEKAQKLIGKLIFATAFVVLLVLFALGRREAVIVGAAVPPLLLKVMPPLNVLLPVSVSTPPPLITIGALA